MNRKNVQFFFSFLVVVAIIIWAGFFSSYKADTNHNLQIYFLNVGQGDSEYIKMPNGEDVLIDGGPDNSVLTELGKIMNFGDHEINLVVLTHPHADHVIGLIQVLQRYKVDEIWESGVDYPSATYDTWKKIISDKNIQDEFVAVGKTKDFSNIKLKVLYPLSSLKNLSDGESGQKIDNVNNASVVTELDFNQFSTLFTGDLEVTLQPQIYNQLHAVTVLKVDHHGSNNGTNDAWLKILRPAIAVIEVGAKNTYGHPYQSTLDLLKNYAAQIYRTDQNGTVEVSSDGVGWWVKPEI